MFVKISAEATLFPDVLSAFRVVATLYPESKVQDWLLQEYKA
jgi:hypothetical protein